jgi:hypothetical protein
MTFGFIVSIMCSGGFVYLCHIYTNWALPILVVCMTVSVVISVALGLMIFETIKQNKKKKAQV